MCTLPHVLDVMQGKEPVTHIDGLYGLVEAFIVPTEDDGVCSACRKEINDRFGGVDEAPKSNRAIREHFTRAFKSFRDTVDHAISTVAGREYKWNINHKVRTDVHGI